MMELLKEKKERKQIDSGASIGVSWLFPHCEHLVPVLQADNYGQEK